MQQERTYNVLVLCTGNSARSILGEVLIKAPGKGKSSRTGRAASLSGYELSGLNAGKLGIFWCTVFWPDYCFYFMTELPL